MSHRAATIRNKRKYGGSEPVRTSMIQTQSRLFEPSHTGNRKPTAGQLALIDQLRREAGDDKTFVPDTRLEAADIIVILKERIKRQTIGKNTVLGPEALEE